MYCDKFVEHKLRLKLKDQGWEEILRCVRCRVLCVARISSLCSNCEQELFENWPEDVSTEIQKY